MARETTFQKRLRAWLDARLPLRTITDVAEHKVVPIHRHSIWYYMGGMTLFLFVVQAITGILLLLYYRPSPNNAFESVRFIMTQVKFGWLIRSIHGWGANLLIFMMFLHMFSVFFLKAYRKPRELTWFTGAAMFAVILGFGFTGYLLPWNQLSFFATKVGSSIAGSLPVIGHFAMRFMRGGDDVTGATLTRFFGWHVAIMPALATLILTVHVLLVQVQGMSVPESVVRKAGGEENIPKIKFFWNFFLRDLLGWVIVLGLIATIAAFHPWELGVKANVYGSAPPNIRPEWYFLFMYQSLKYLPAHVGPIAGDVIGIVGFGLAGVAWMLAPLFDRKPGTKISRALTWIGVAAVTFMIVMTTLAYVAPGN